MADKGDDDCLHRRAYSLSTSTLRETRFLSQQRPFLVVYFVGLGHTARPVDSSLQKPRPDAPGEPFVRNRVSHGGYSYGPKMDEREIDARSHHFSNNHPTVGQQKLAALYNPSSRPVGESTCSRGVRSGGLFFGNDSPGKLSSPADRSSLDGTRLAIAGYVRFYSRGSESAWNRVMRKLSRFIETSRHILTNKHLRALRSGYRLARQYILLPGYSA